MQMWGGRPRPQPGPLAGLVARLKARPGGRARVRGPAPLQHEPVYYTIPLLLKSAIASES